MFHLDWRDIITDDLLTTIRNTVGLSSNTSLVDIEECLSRIFEMMGGYPLFDHELNESEKTSLGLKLLTEATRRVLASTPISLKPSGFILTKLHNQSIKYEVEQVERVAINSAQLNELEILPEIGETISARIIDDRTNSGAFSNIEEFTDRINGLGEASQNILETAVRFDHPDDEWQYSLLSDADFHSVFGTYVRLSNGVDSGEQLHTALERLETSISGSKHPATSSHRKRTLNNQTELEFINAEWAGVLLGSEYFKNVPDMLINATISIDVCMFHIAFTKDNHPTRILLDALVTAHSAGVLVRVLLDRDRKNDVYNSTIINTRTKEFLDKNSIPCRFDDEATLLHSKFLIIDHSMVIIGSHNWSAGSFFHFDDLSVATKSLTYASSMTERFDTLWDSSATS